MSGYVLCAEERKHLSDVKCVTATSSGHIFAASRDGTASIMGVRLSDSSATITTESLLVAHEGFVNFVLYHPSMPMLDGEPAVITGSNDKHVLVWSAISGAMEAVLDCHSQGVRCGAVISPSNDFVTCGWDKLCIVWDGFSGRSKNVFDKHGNSVLCVAQLPETNVLVTGSGDKTLMSWNVDTAEVVHRFNGHTDSVQAVAALNPLQFASSGNDGLVIVWDNQDGAPVFQFQAHEAFVYSMCWNEATAMLYTASEDRTVCVWLLHADRAEGVDCLAHPCVVWSVATIPDSDEIVTSGSDAGVRIWTRHTPRIAPPGLLEALSTAASIQKDDIKTIRSLPSTIPPEEDRDRFPGTRIGARGYFKITALDEIGSFVWTGLQWVRIGTVVQGPGAAPISASQGAAPRQKVPHQGKLFDYVFDVEISGAKLKLPYNSGQNVFDAAQNFINENAHLGVSQMDREAIQMHIINNIDPSDAAKVGAGLGMAGAPKGTGGSSDTGSAAFSEFAKEAEALRARGVAQAKSWGEQYKQLQEGGGEDVAFSTFAKEAQQAAAASANGRGSSSTAAASSSSSLAPLTSAEIFKGYSAEKAAAKVAELVGCRDYDNTITSLDKLAMSSEGDVEEVVTCLVALQAALSELRQLFPVLDGFRLLFSNPSIANAVYQIASDSILSLLREGVFTTATASDADKLCALRLLANALACSQIFAANFSNNAHDLRGAVFSWIRTKVLPTQNANVKSSLRIFLLHAVLTCVGQATARQAQQVVDAHAGQQAAETTAFVDTLVASVAQSMLYDSAEESYRSFLSALLAMNRVPSLRSDVQSSLSRHLAVVLRTMRNGQNLLFANAAKELFPG